MPVIERFGKQQFGKQITVTIEQDGLNSKSMLNDDSLGHSINSDIDSHNSEFLFKKTKTKSIQVDQGVEKVLNQLLSTTNKNDILYIRN